MWLYLRLVFKPRCQMLGRGECISKITRWLQHPRSHTSNGGYRVLGRGGIHVGAQMHNVQHTHTCVKRNVLLPNIECTVVSMLVLGLRQSEVNTPSRERPPKRARISGQQPSTRTPRVSKRGASQRPANIRRANPSPTLIKSPVWDPAGGIGNPARTSFSADSTTSARTWTDLGPGCCTHVDPRGWLFNANVGTLQACKANCLAFTHCGYILYGWTSSGWCSVISANSTSCSDRDTSLSGCRSSVRSYKWGHGSAGLRLAHVLYYFWRAGWVMGGWQYRPGTGAWVCRPRTLRKTGVPGFNFDGFGGVFA